jgi:hypothetical protein
VVGQVPGSLSQEQRTTVDLGRQAEGKRGLSRFQSLSDAGLGAKFRALAAEALPGARIEALLAKCWSVAESRDVAELARLAVPQGTR